MSSSPARSWLAGATCAGAAAALGLLALPASAAAMPAGCTGTAPIICQFDVAPGNYDVTATTGAGTGLSVETRRRILAPGAAGTYQATVNVRTPQGQPTDPTAGTPGLTLTFDGTAPSVSAVTVTPASKPLVAYLAGDSTVCDQMTIPYTGWGQILTASIGPGASIANYSDSGESSASFRANAALFPTMRPLIRAGDLAFIQFGHNDKTTTAAAYRDNLTAMVTGVRQQGGIPVLVTPPVRRLFSGSALTETALHVNGLGVNLPAEMRAVAAANQVPLIDLTAKSEALVEGLGSSASSRIYLTTATDGVADNTHFSEYGAGEMAKLVTDGIRQLQLPLATYLR
ncbi:MAG TPA: rhamnogalacturonan acetylesterase [Actinoplanes sp.]|jgi:lysophospholipase L1-like esterase